MRKSVISYLEASAQKYPDKTAYVDEHDSLTFGALKEAALAIGAGLIPHVQIGDPVCVYMEKSVGCIESFLGTAYTGAFYVPIDFAMPEARIRLILDTLNAQVILTKRGIEVPAGLCEGCTILCIEDLKENVDAGHLAEIAVRQRKTIDTNPIYAIFTSGSTGVPKGVLVSHQSVINFTEWWCETFEFTEKEVFANQTPFYFDASVKDIYATLRCGATMYIVPQKLFSLPAKLVEFLNEHKVNCIDWVPSVLCMIVNFRTFQKVKPLYLKKVMFLGEVMPTKQFNMWRKELPDIKYANLYGPTEATGDCTYYKIEREFADDEPIPIGEACNNTEVLLLNEKNELVQGDEQGEICVRGCSLALGYYNNPTKTSEAFVQNPLQDKYPELIYRTGDIGRYNSYGEIVFCARKDAQIKHMGHRIELGEIENSIASQEDIRRVCCLFDKAKQKIVAVYEGDIESKELISRIKNKIPKYMIPQIYHRVDTMPTNLNGKIDRVRLQKIYIEGEK